MTTIASESLWNQTFADLPDHCDVLVAGAGPAGSACARLLAQAGWRVVLVDAQRFPRDKTCGDGLVPDTHDALRRLGLYEEVLAQARALPFARCVAPSGRWVDVPGELASLSRRALDAILAQGAVLAGAHMHAPVKLMEPVRDSNGRVVGATLAQGSEQRQIRCRWLVLATGAAAGPLVASQACQRREHTGVAVRAYVRHTGVHEALPGMHFVWHPALKGGYGWIFPGPDHTYNIGAGTLTESSSNKVANPRDVFDTFVRVDPVAARLMREGQTLGPLKGAPLRCSLQGADWHQDGMLVVGDAVGATYAFSGEGIGKAMETGMAAAEAIRRDERTSPFSNHDAQVRQHYQTQLQALLPRFQMYSQAASFNSMPWLLSLVVWRARHSPRLIDRMADILAERRLPGSLLSWRGLKRMVLG